MNRRTLLTALVALPAALKALGQPRSRTGLVLQIPRAKFTDAKTGEVSFVQVSIPLEGPGPRHFAEFAEREISSLWSQIPVKTEPIL